MKGQITVQGQRVFLSDVPGDTGNPGELFEVVDQALVDDEQWYTVITRRPECAKWIRTHDDTLQYEHQGRHVIGYIFDIHQHLHLMLKLKFT
jgi:hypothetical protein